MVGRGPGRASRAMAIYLAFLLLMPLMPVNFEDNVSAVEGPKTIVVAKDGSGDYTWIQDAINASVDGDTVFVKNGTYNEHIFINKSITLEGESNSSTIINGEATGTVVTINADNTNITNIRITNSGLIEGEAGILINSSHNTISYCNISHNNYYGIFVFRNRDNNTVSRCEFYRNEYDCIRIELSENNTVSNNILFWGRYGIRLIHGSRNNQVKNNFIDAMWGGVVIEGSSNNSVSNNIINRSTGIYVTYAVENVIFSNIFLECYPEAINLYHSDNNTLNGNTFRREAEEYAIRLSYSNNNTIYHNNFYSSYWTFDDVSRVYNIENSENNTWNNSRNEGNYWSDYQGLDNDGDGIGDYMVPHHNADYYPLALPYDNGVQKTLVGNSTLTVSQDGSGDFGTIQDAINASVTGNTVYIKNGIYHEWLDVNKSITLIGETNSDTVIKVPYGKAISINEHFVTVKNLKVISMYVGFPNATIYTWKDHTSIESCVIEYVSSGSGEHGGICFQGGFHRSINNGRITNNTINVTGMVDTAKGYTKGIDLDLSENIIVWNNSINMNINETETRFGYGIVTRYAFNVSIQNNTVDGNWYNGIRIEEFTYVINISNNHLEGGMVIWLLLDDMELHDNYVKDGIGIRLSAYNWNDSSMITGNYDDNGPLVFLLGATNMTVDNASQVHLKDCSNISILDLTISEKALGIMLYKSDNITIYNCSFFDIYESIEIKNSENITIVQNVFVNNMRTMDWFGNDISAYNNYISDNLQYNIEQNQTSEFIENRGNRILIANNYWGHPSGPYHATLNPNGTGVSIEGNVTIEPWLTYPPAWFALRYLPTPSFITVDFVDLNGNYTLRWNTTENAEKYLLYENSTLMANTTENNFNITGRTTGNYTYNVSAWNINGTSGLSPPIIITVIIPPAPTDTTSPLVLCFETEVNYTALPITFSGNITDENNITKMEYSIDFGPWASLPVETEWSLTFDNLTYGNHTFIVRATDEEGNAGRLEYDFTLIDPNAKEEKESFSIDIPLELSISILLAAIFIFLFGYVGIEVIKLFLVTYYFSIHAHITKEEQMDHLVRKYIKKHIEHYPGAAAGDIQKALELPNGPFYYHLGLLELEGAIRSFRDGRRRRYHIAEGEIPYLDLNMTRTEQEIVEHLVKHGRKVREEFLEDTGKCEHIVKHYMLILKEKHYASIELYGKYTFYTPTIKLIELYKQFHHKDLEESEQLVEEALDWKEEKPVEDKLEWID